MARRTPVIDPEEQKPSKDELAQAIIRISAAVDALKKSGLNEKAIIALVKDHSGVPKATIGFVLDSLAMLRKDYCAK